jgi:asparagine synthase (glutamine-hydrolysing)
MFAFAIYNSKLNQIFIARDHLGQKPLYFFHQNGQFAFASEIKSLLALLPGLNELDEEALYEYLTLRIITPPRSMFKKIRKLQPAHYLTFKDGKLDIKRYWNLRYEPKLKADYPEIISELERRIISTVKYHLVSDVPVGVFLSGGLDSSLIAAMMRKVTTEEIQSFSGDVQYEGHSEIHYARIMAEKCHTKHHELSIKPSLIKTLPDLIWHLDEPSDSLSVCVYSLAELTRKHVKVVLGGDGGDELFGGYDRYYGNILVSRYAFLPEFFRRKILGELLKIIPEGFWYKSLSHRLRWIHQMSFYQNSERYAKSLSYFYFSNGFRKNLYTEKFYQKVGMFDPGKMIQDLFECSNASHVIDKMLYADSMTRMPDHPVMILDRMTMAHGLEARSPFLDHKLAEFCASIPAKYKVKGTKLRCIQVELAKKYLPKELIKKRKQGFSSALPYLLEKEFKILYNLFLKDSHLARDGYLKNETVKNLLDEHLKRKMDHGNRLWLLSSAEVWYRMYIENQSRNQIMALLLEKSDYGNT